MSRRLRLAALVVLAVVQIAVPLRMIARRQATLAEGELLRFRTAPVDPYDAFRGRYVALRMADDVVSAAARDWAPGQRAFVPLETGPEGFARPAGLERRRPAGGPYVEVTVSPSPAGSREVRLRYPFDRYYLNERLAPAAEAAYRQHAGGEEHAAWVAVRVRDGFAVLEELYIGDRPIGEFLAARE